MKARAVPHSRAERNAGGDVNELRKPFRTVCMLMILFLTALGQGTSPAQHASEKDPLPSWNDRAAKRGIIEFVQRTTQPGGPDFAPVDERIAAFDKRAIGGKMSGNLRWNRVLVLVTSAVLVLQTTGIDRTTAQTGKAPAASSQVTTQDIGWPRQKQNANGTLVYYQPQIDEWKDYRTMSGRMAFSLTPTGAKQALGVVSLHCETVVDKDSRTVYIQNVTVDSVRFPSQNEQASEKLKKLFMELIPKNGNPISLDRVIADVDRSKVETKPVVLHNEPPPIFYSASPALLLIVQGDPVLAPIEKTDLQFIVNTNWDLFFEKKQKTYYLLANKGWFTAKDLKGSWQQTQALPTDMAKLPAGQNFDDVKKMVPPPPPSGAVPKIFFSTTPAELILVKGSQCTPRFRGPASCT